MRQKHRISVVALTLALAFLVSLVTPPVVVAASPYDNLYRQGSFLIKNGNCVGDATTSWIDVINSPNKWANSIDHQPIIAGHLTAAVADGIGWAVIQREAKANHDVGNISFTTGDRYLTVLIGTGSTTELNFTTTLDYGKVLLPSAGVDVVQMALVNSGGQPCSVKVIGASVSVTSWYSPFAIEDSGAYFFNSLVRYNQVFVNFPINYPVGYEGLLVPTEPPAAKYVAAGDSFSTGEGNPAFEAGSAEDGVNECHRSPQAYPRLVQSALNLGPTAFVACSGATTNDVLGIPDGDNPHGKWNEPAQIDALSDETEIVTITIGGNDIGFGDFGYECLFPVNLTHGTCDEFTDIYDETVWKINNELPDKLKNVYGALLNEAENAEIYVLGYPHIAPYKTTEDIFDQDCGGLYDEFPNNWGDARAAHEVTELLNDTIEDAVNATSAQYSTDRLKFVSVDEGAFAGHDACSDDSYFHGIVFPDTEYSVHPDVDGQIAYAVDLAGAMS